MNREVTPKQRKLIHSCIVAPVLATTIYHVARISQNLPLISLLLFLVAATLAPLSLWTVERKYVYKLPTKGDLGIYSAALLLVGGVNFSIEYNIHGHDNLHEAVSSLLSLLCILPFMLFVGQKKSIPIKRARIL